MAYLDVSLVRFGVSGRKVRFFLFFAFFPCLVVADKLSPDFFCLGFSIPFLFGFNFFFFFLTSNCLCLCRVCVVCGVLLLAGPCVVYGYCYSCVLFMLW